jgi:hypothetical protein
MSLLTELENYFGFGSTKISPLTGLADATDGHSSN